MSMSINAWQTLKDEASLKGLPQRYKNDLDVHDRESIERYGDASPFLWFLRENGTHYVPLGKHYTDVAATVRAITMTFGEGTQGGWYHWDGKVLLKVDDDKAVRLALDSDLAAQGQTKGKTPLVQF